MTDTHVIKAPEVSISKTQMHPLVTAAMSGGAIDTQTLKELMDLQERWEKGEAKKAFVQAMVSLKRELPSILNRDKQVSFKNTKYSFTSLSSAMDAISPHLTQFGFSLSWTPVTNEKDVSVTCRITHTDAHYEETTLSAPADNSGSKNAVQAIGSTISYLQRYTALSLLGIATADMKCADDPDCGGYAVDADKIIHAVGYMQSVGIGIGEATRHVQRDVRDWTAGDLDKLRELVKSRQANAPAKTMSQVTEGLRIKVIEGSVILWPDDSEVELNKLLYREECTIETANKEQLQWALDYINNHIDGADQK